jgi:hypothetical protein
MTIVVIITSAFIEEINITQLVVGCVSSPDLEKIVGGKVFCALFE